MIVSLYVISSVEKSDALFSVHSIVGRANIIREASIFINAYKTAKMYQMSESSYELTAT